MNTFVAEIFWDGLFADFVDFGGVDGFVVHLETPKVIAEINHAAFANQWHHVVDQRHRVVLDVPVGFRAFAVGIGRWI